MALRMLEGFDHFNTLAQAQKKGWNENGTLFSRQFGAGRINGFGLQLQFSFNTGFWWKVIPGATFSEIIVGFSYYHSVQSTADCRFLLLQTNASSDVISLYCDSAQRVKVKNGSGTVIATGTTAMPTGTHHYVELRLKINGASGECEVRLNGAAEIATTTGNFGSTNVDRLYFIGENAAGQQNGGLAQFDDLYVCDTSGSLNNTFLGDVHVETLLPSADGSHSDFTPNSGTTHYNRVNNAQPDDDTTYSSDATVGDIDSFAYADLAILSGRVYGVQTNLWARKDDATLRQIKALIRSGGTDYTPGATQTLATSYVDYQDVFETDPNTGAAWDIAGVNAAEFGIKIVT